ncbi:MAG: hypothetical protein RBS57_17480 [Desulforhabdus sp.]|nr:hypothetical protein [Desulforhabdus sp.]
MTAILEQHLDRRTLPKLRPAFTLPTANSAKLREAVKEAIEILDESRKAFKSKRLETLRKRLTQVLADAD